MKRLSSLALVFSIAFLVFFFMPAFLNKQFSAYPLMKTGDVFDLFTPLVLIPLYWLLFRVGAEKSPSTRETVFFLVFAAFWVMGQGMHLSANSIGHLVDKMKGTDVYSLTNFYDEVLSHYLWHFGVVALSGLIIYRQWRNPLTESQRIPWIMYLAGVIYGFSFAVIVLEGVTWLMGIPFAVLAALFGLVWGWRKLGSQPLLAFFLIVYVVAILLFAGWVSYWGEPLEPSKWLGF